MAYRLFCLSGTGNFTSVETFDVQSDEEAISLARARKLPIMCELWDGNRLVAQIPAHLEVNRATRLFQLAIVAGSFSAVRWAEMLTAASA